MRGRSETVRFDRGCQAGSCPWTLMRWCGSFAICHTVATYIFRYLIKEFRHEHNNADDTGTMCFFPMTGALGPTGCYITRRTQQSYSVFHRKDKKQHDKKRKKEKPAMRQSRGLRERKVGWPEVDPETERHSACSKSGGRRPSSRGDRRRWSVCC